MKAATLPHPTLRSIGTTFVKLAGQTTRDPLPHSMRDLLRSIEAKEKLDRERQESILSRVWKCVGCGEVTVNPQPTFWPVPCPMCGGIVFQAMPDDG